MHFYVANQIYQCEFGRIVLLSACRTQFVTQLFEVRALVEGRGLRSMKGIVHYIYPVAHMTPQGLTKFIHSCVLPKP